MKGLTPFGIWGKPTPSGVVGRSDTRRGGWIRKAHSSASLRLQSLWAKAYLALDCVRMQPRPEKTQNNHACLAGPAAEHMSTGNAKGPSRESKPGILKNGMDF